MILAVITGMILAKLILKVQPSDADLTRAMLVAGMFCVPMGWLFGPSLEWGVAGWVLWSVVGLALVGWDERRSRPHLGVAK
jgi:hypothetical protein